MSSTVRIVWVDVETTFMKYTKAELKELAIAANSPMLPRNRLVSLVLQDSDGRMCEADSVAKASKLLAPLDEEEHVVWAGVNIKFDANWLITESPKLGNHLRNGNISLYDIQHAHYMNTGMTHRMPSMNEMAAHYGLTTKLDVVKSEYWDKGIDTDGIPIDVLLEYNRHDVELTKQLYHATLADITANGLSEALRIDMNATAFLLDLEQRGLPMDDTVAIYALRDLTHTADELREKGMAYLDTVEYELVPTKGGTPITETGFACYEWDVTIGSGKFMSMYQGKPTTIKRKEAVGTYKGGQRKGQLKYGWVSYSCTFPTLSRLSPTTYNDTEIKKAVEAYPNDEFLGTLLERRKIDKELNTYIRPFLRTASETTTGRLHPTYNQSVTTTGRLSSTNPNGQNLGGKWVKKLIRPDVGNVIYELDFSQMEMIGLYIITGDERLYYDIADGVDLHYETGLTAGLWKDEESMTDGLRRRVKAVNFGLVYGGGAKTLAEQSGLPVGTVKRLIEAFYSRYKGVQAYHDGLGVALKNGTVYTGNVTKKGSKEAYADMHYPSGRIARLYKDESKWGYKFSPTKAKNYKVQGTATGDMVPCSLGEVAALYAADPKLRHIIQPIATVHDSIIFEGTGGIKGASAARALARTMEQGATIHYRKHVTNSVYRERLAKANKLLKVDVKRGASWGGLNEKLT